MGTCAYKRKATLALLAVPLIQATCLIYCSYNRTLEQCGSKEEYDQYLEDVEDISKPRLVL